MNKTNIEFCDYTLNPVVGCSHCSPGCDNCYAERIANNLLKEPKTAKKYQGTVNTDGKWTGKINIDLDFLSGSKTANPEKKSKSLKSKRIFVGSMCDLFNEEAYKEFDKKYFDKTTDSFRYVIHNLWNMFYKNPQNTYILLTKRPKGMKKAMEYLEKQWTKYFLNIKFPLPNVWLGLTVCDQQEVDEKMPIFMEIPAHKRFVNAEPLLEEISLWGWFSEKLDWVACGGETGPNARLMNPDWARELYQQCKTANIHFFLKQIGNNKPVPSDLQIRQFPW